VTWENKVIIIFSFFYFNNFDFNLDEATVRVTNLPEETQEQDLRDLFTPFGPVNRVFLAKDKTNNTSKGFAFITFNEKKDAQKAIECVSGFGYDHLILKVEWAKYTLLLLLYLNYLLFFVFYFSKPQNQ
jgi:translation initiation factor 3 subunit G